MRGLIPRSTRSPFATRTRLCGAALALALALAGLSPVMAQPAELMLLDLCVDDRCHGVAAVLRIDDGIWIERGAMERASLDQPALRERVVDGRTYLDPSSLPGVQVRLDLSALRVDLDIPPEARPGQTLSAARPEASPDITYPWAAYLNYSLGVEDGGRSDLFTDASLGRGPVALRSTALWTSSTGFSRGLTRLELDQPTALRRWIIGDQFAGSSDALGGGALVGGVGVQRAFEQDPFLNTFPQPFVAGVVDAPGIVEIYANGQLLARREIQPGPFTFEGLGVPPGRSDVQVVLRDPFGGRREIGGMTYYGSSSLLSEGLSDYAVRVGLPRNASLGGSYGSDPLVQAFYRRGLSDRLTLGGRVEADARVANAGLDAGVRTGLGEFGLTLASSRHDQVGSGQAFALRHVWSTRTWSLSSGWRRFDPTYRTVAAPGLDGVTRAREDSFVSGSWSPEGRWSMRANLGTRRLEQHRERNAGVGLGLQLSGRARLLANLERRLGPGGHDTVGFVSVVVALDAPRDSGWAPHSASAGLGWNDSSDPVDLRAGVRRSRPAATGWGYDIDLGHGDAGTRGFGQVEYQGRHARYALQAQRVGGFERVRAQASGSVVGIGGRVFVAPPLDAGFALVRLPGVEGIPVEREGLEVVRTDARGDALVRGLLPWYPARVGFDATRLPIGYRYDTALKRVVVAPGTGAIAEFDVTALQSLRGRVLLGRSRTPADLGMLVVLDDSGAELARSPLGRDGGFWFDHLAPGTYDGRVLHDGREYRCRLALQGPARAGIANAGDVHCLGNSDGN